MSRPNLRFLCRHLMKDANCYLTSVGYENLLFQLEFERYGNLKNVFWAESFRKERTTHSNFVMF